MVDATTKKRYDAFLEFLQWLTDQTGTGGKIELPTDFQVDRAAMIDIDFLGEKFEEWTEILSPFTKHEYSYNARTKRKNRYVLVVLRALAKMYGFGVKTKRTRKVSKGTFTDYNIYQLVPME